MNSNAIKQLGTAVIRTETQAIAALESRIDDNFVRACEILYNCSGRVVVSGMGKSGHIGGKIAATFASTGSPSFFIHPGEAAHGDLGMIQPDDVFFALSNSGETAELLTIAPIIRRRGVPIVALTGKPDSSLATMATVHIDTSVSTEACPLGLAPTASTTAALAMGDAIAVALLDKRGFTPDDFARSHPGGALGRRLLLHVDDVMRSGDKIPRVSSGTKLSEALVEVSQKGLGMTVVMDANDEALGVFTDGDLRRALDHNLDLRDVEIDNAMTRDFKRVAATDLTAQAVALMQANKITSVLVFDEQSQLAGVLHMHDLLAAGVI
ncbi:MAG: KpsF/GutQ family sugar-phosphate isomerase [Pseudomonadota bacterium]